MKPPRLPGLRRLLAPMGVRRNDGGAAAGESPVAQQLQEELARRRRAQAKAARERRLRTLMTPLERTLMRPERTLTRQAMEQIRFLRQLLPEEWPVERLAQGFHVQPEVIRKVLKSRFCPSPERSRKQDASISRGRQPGPQGRQGGVPAASLPLPVGPGRRR